MKKCVEIPPFDEIKFISKIKVLENGCWQWMGGIEKKTGYGYFSIKVGGKFVKRKAHRVAYQLFEKNLDPSLVIDHECKNRFCVNTKHHRQVTIGVNSTENSIGVTAMNKSKTQCKNGHGFDDENTYIYGKHRICKTCARIRSGVVSDRPGQFNRSKTHCPKFHEYNEENTYKFVTKNGKNVRGCKKCRHDANQKRRSL